jgi:predicted ferric reductase
MLHHPGQFMFVKVYGQGIKKEFHPFTITSPKNSDKLSFAPKELGDFTKQLANLKPGDKAIVEGPYGKFEFDIFNNHKQIWIAGGIGITPFLAGIRTLQTDHSYDVHFYYSAKNPAEAVYIPEIQELQKTIPNITLIPFYQETDGFLTMQIVATKTSDFKERDIFLCGPPAMMKAMKKQALELGVAESNLHSEEFALYEGK